MKKLVEQYAVLFNNRARAILLHLQEEFGQVIKPLDRQWDENVFQLQKARYYNRLQQQLRIVENEMVNDSRDGSTRIFLQQALNELVEYYLREFRQGAGAM